MAKRRLSVHAVRRVDSSSLTLGEGFGRTENRLVLIMKDGEIYKNTTQ